MSSVKFGLFSSNSDPPLGSIPWNRSRLVPPELMHSWDPLSPWFSVLDTFSLVMGGVPTPATILPLLQEDPVSNDLSLRVPPPKHRYANPVSSQGHPLQIRRHRALQHGQLSAMSSQGCAFTPNQNSVRSSRGHPPPIRRYRALHLGQLSARSSWGHALAPDQHSIGSYEVASSVSSEVPAVFQGTSSR